MLIDETGHARLTDFGLLTILSDPTNRSASSSYPEGGSGRWMSPELIEPERFGSKCSRPTKSSDCYALGMVVYETVSGNVPFYGARVQTVFVKVLAGEHPPQGLRFTKDLWDMLKNCWMFQPNDRPSIEEVLQSLKAFSDSPVPLSAVLDKRTDSHNDDSDSTDSLSGILNAKGDMTTVGGAFTPSDLDDHLSIPRRRNLFSPTPWVGSDDGDTHQVDLFSRS